MTPRDSYTTNPQAVAAIGDLTIEHLARSRPCIGGAVMRNVQRAQGQRKRRAENLPHFRDAWTPNQRWRRVCFRPFSTSVMS